MGNRGLYSDGWKIATYHGRKPWENKAAWGFDQDHWELDNLADDPSEANDLMKDQDGADLDDPMVKQLIELAGLWWAGTGKYQVLPLDACFQVRALGREALHGQREHLTFDEGSVRIPPFEAPQTLNRPWAASAETEVPGRLLVGDAKVAEGSISGPVRSATPWTRPSTSAGQGHPGQRGLQTHRPVLRQDHPNRLSRLLATPGEQPGGWPGRSTGVATAARATPWSVAWSARSS